MALFGPVGSIALLGIATIWALVKSIQYGINVEAPLAFVEYPSTIFSVGVAAIVFVEIWPWLSTAINTSILWLTSVL